MASVAAGNPIQKDVAIAAGQSVGFVLLYRPKIQTESGKEATRRMPEGIVGRVLYPPGMERGYQFFRRRPGTASKCWSRLRTGSRCCSARAAIQASLAGIGRPDRLSATRSPA